MRRVTSLLVALHLGFAGACKNDEAPSPTATAPSSSPPPAVEAPVPTPTTPPVVVPAGAPSYPASVDDLLALVPKDAEAYMIVRDPGALIRGATWLLDAERDAMNALVTATKSGGKADAADIAELENFLAKYGPIAAQLAGDLQLDRGAIVFESNGANAIMFSASDPEALRNVGHAAGIEVPGDTFPCRTLPAREGIVACADDPKALMGILPGEAAATRRAEIGKLLPGVDIERANVIGVSTGLVKFGFAMETSPGLVQLDIQTSAAPPEMKKFFAAGTPNALEAVAPGTTFIWGNADVAALGPEIEKVPAPLTNVLKSVTGEYLYASTVDPFAMVLLVGATDPQPFRGAMALMVLGLGGGKIPLPDGTTVDVKLENFATDAGDVQAVHATLGERPDLAQFAAFGFKGEAFGFSAGKWIALAIGSDSAIVPKIAKLGGTGPSAELLASLPAGLARALGAGEARFALHLSFDALQTAALRDATKVAIAGMPKTADPVAAAMAERALDVLAPLSTVSGWLTWNDVGPQIHLAVQTFSDPSTDAGKAAQVAVGDVAKGSDPAQVYGALADRFADSPRGMSYRIRAGRVPGTEAASLGAVALVGMLAAIAIPAFVKYTKRARGE